MADVIKRITGRTLVPLSLVIALMGGGGWMTKLHSQTDANSIMLDRSLASQKELLMYIIEIKQQLAEIKGELKRIHHN